MSKQDSRRAGLPVPCLAACPVASSSRAYGESPQSKASELCPKSSVPLLKSAVSVFVKHSPSLSSHSMSQLPSRCVLAARFKRLAAGPHHAPVIRPQGMLISPKLHLDAPERQLRLTPLQQAAGHSQVRVQYLLSVSTAIDFNVCSLVNSALPAGHSRQLAEQPPERTLRCPSPAGTEPAARAALPCPGRLPALAETAVWQARSCQPLLQRMRTAPCRTYLSAALSCRI